VTVVNSSAPADDPRGLPSFRTRRQASPTAFSTQLRSATATQSAPAPRTAAPPARRPAASARTASPAVGPEDAGKYASLINDSATRHGVDPTLVAAVTRAESNFNPNAVSGAGAKGLIQLMGGTAPSLGVTN
jgi:soluble lytic murein transglycosylase-like protein